MIFSLRIYLLAWIYHLAFVVQAESFLKAISAYPQLSNFTSLLKANPSLATSLLSFSASIPQTVLVPDDNAFLNYQKSTHETFSSQSQDYLQAVTQYHILDGNLSSQDFLHPAGITVPTGLTGPTYDNRTAGDALIFSSAITGNNNGQVVFIAPNTTSTSFKTRQLSSSAYVQSGLGHQVNLTTLDGTWDGGRFHIVDGFLTLPEPCTKTITAWGLSSLTTSLNRTGLSSILDHSNNVTCLGPSNQAFLEAGSPDVKANISTLSTALAFHTIPMPLYSNFLTNGQTFTSLSGDTVRVTIMSGGEIYFNDAKVTQLNVLTNNGLMHVLDKVMSPLDSESLTSTTTRISTAATTKSSSKATSTAKSSSTPATSEPSSAARAITSEPLGWSVWRVFYTCFVLFI